MVSFSKTWAALLYRGCAAASTGHSCDWLLCSVAIYVQSTPHRAFYPFRCWGVVGWLIHERASFYLTLADIDLGKLFRFRSSLVWYDSIRHLYIIVWALITWFDCTDIRLRFLLSLPMPFDVKRVPLQYSLDSVSSIDRIATLRFVTLFFNSILFYTSIVSQM